ncbi:MAG: enoyl-CoA hydratase/isomerase family protein [Caulobacteraceae bacterium]|nr:enoyl-CoA hydratase/isomerase family protein [Caulobacteraceae bacterium]
MSHTMIQVRHEVREGGRFAFVTIDNRAKLNVLSAQVMDDFVAAMAPLFDDDALRGVVIEGAGDRAFVGGADIDEMAAIDSPAEARAFISRVHACCAAVRDFPVPVIAAIRGWCLGAGMELAAACDVRLADSSARFGMPEVKLGIPSVVEAAILPGLIGWGRTRDLLIFGEVIDARRAFEIGFVDQLVQPDALESAVEARLSALLTSRPCAVRLQKALIRTWETLPLAQAIAAGVESFADAFETAEPSQAMAEFQKARAARRG